MRNVKLLAMIVGVFAVVGFGLAAATDNPLRQTVLDTTGGHASAPAPGDNSSNPAPPPDANNTRPCPPMPGERNGSEPCRRPHPPANDTNDTKRTRPVPPPLPPMPVNRTHIVVEPRFVVLDVNCTLAFTAKAYDKDGKEITGVKFSWSVRPALPPVPPLPPVRPAR